MPVAPFNLDPDWCRKRQARLCDVLRAQHIEWAVFVDPDNVQYLTGFRPHRLMSAGVCLDRAGECLLIAPNSAPELAAADRIVTFEAQWCSTLRQDQAQAVAQALAAALSGHSTKGRVGIEFGRTSVDLLKTIAGGSLNNVVDLEPVLHALRRAKDPDELAMICRAIDCTEAMYARARAIIAPGITELAVYNALSEAAVAVAGEPLSAPLGNDFQCNSPGGPPRSRPAEKGELFILDLGPAYRGYYADNCRTFCVGQSPSAEQQRAWETIVAVLEMVEETVCRGVSCRDVYAEARTMLDVYRPGAFFHHLGHGFGLFPHEGPHLNPHWDDAFAEGDVFTAEPGLYGPELRAGIRLEQNYRVTADGVERLTRFPLEL